MIILSLHNTFVARNNFLRHQGNHFLLLSVSFNIFSTSVEKLFLKSRSVLRGFQPRLLLSSDSVRELFAQKSAINADILKRGHTHFEANPSSAYNVSPPDHFPAASSRLTLFTSSVLLTPCVNSASPNPCATSSQVWRPFAEK